ncbi:MAG: serine hydrolase [Ignavibacteriaceae bacterium]|nr:serine hydrolase [Ignavibacteriaceae bacterium]
MSKKRVTNNILIGIIIFLAIILSPAQITSLERIFISDTKYPSVFKLTEKEKEWIETKLSEMTLYEKCAQMIMPAVYRNDLDPSSNGYKEISSLVREQKIGGLILYQGGIVEQAKFINDMQRISDIPLLIASDFERGLGQRIDNATEFPHAMALGSANNVSYAYEMGKAISIECRLLGVHWNFAPVADINNNPLNPIINIRAYSENKYEVAKFIEAFINGAKEERSLTTIKHFPGHGNTTIDSHRDLPQINGSKDFLLKNELYPFTKAIGSKVHSVMVGHLDVPSLEPVKGIPATLSKSIVDHLLKKELGFDGLIVTDAMIMEAITKYYSTEEAVVLAVKAGNDVILSPPDDETAITALSLAVYSGEISINRIDESVRKILAAKRWLRIEQNKFSDIDKIKQSVTIKGHKNLAKEIAENSITLLKNDDGLLPLNLNEHKNIYCVTLTDGIGTEKENYFQNIFEDRVGEINSVLLTKKSKRWEYNNLLKEIKDFDLIILSTFLDVKTYQGPINLAAEQTDFITGVLRSGIPTVLISFKNPYLLYLFPESSTYLNSFSHSRVSQKAMLRAILGEIDVKGTLPITIPETEIAFRNGLKLQKSLYTTIESESKVELNKVDKKIKSALTENLFPGVVVCLGTKDKIKYHNAIGSSGFSNYSNTLDKNDIFNIGTITGFVATAQSIMILVNIGIIKLDDPAYFYLAEFNDEEKRKITIEHLLLHTSGIASTVKNLNPMWNKEELNDNIFEEELVHPPGTNQNYSILNFVVLQKIIETVTGKNIDEYINAIFYSPIGMKKTNFNSISDSSNLLFTSSHNNNLLYTSVKTSDDVIQEIMNGVSGFGGLHSTTYDLAIFSQMLLQKGYYADTQYLKANTVKIWSSLEKNKSVVGLRTQPYTTMNGKHNYIPEMGFMFIDPQGSAIMIDMEKQIFLIVLSNPSIHNPANQSFVKLVNELIEFVNSEIN